MQNILKTMKEHWNYDNSFVHKVVILGVWGCIASGLLVFLALLGFLAYIVPSTATQAFIVVAGLGVLVYAVTHIVDDFFGQAKD